MGGNARKTGKFFHVRKKVTDERQDHCSLILAAISNSKILGKPQLKPIPRTPSRLPSDNPKIKRVRFPDLIISTQLLQQLTAPQKKIPRIPAINFKSQIKPLRELMRQRSAASKNRSSSFNTHHAGQRIPSKCSSTIDPQNILRRKRL